MFDTGAIFYISHSLKHGGFMKVNYLRLTDTDNTQSDQIFFLIFIYLFCFLGLQVWHMEAPRLGVKWDLQLPAYATATAVPDPSHVCNLQLTTYNLQAHSNPGFLTQ